MGLFGQSGGCEGGGERIVCRSLAAMTGARLARDGTSRRGIRCGGNKVGLVRRRDNGGLRGLESAANWGFPGSIKGWLAADEKGSVCILVAFVGSVE